MAIGRPRVERVEVECTRCGKQMERYAHLVERSRTGRFFCSEACLRAWGGPRGRRGIERPCEQCGTPVYSQPAARCRRFCSRDCHYQWRARNAQHFTCEVCGKKVRLSPSQKRARLGGRFCSRTCMGDAFIARPLDRKHNGRVARLNNDGYVMLYEPSHPRADRGGWVFEHRLIVEARVGRYLRQDEHVHHLNGTKDDNRSENLVVMGHLEHLALEAGNHKAGIVAMQAELEEYRRRFGPLPDKEE